MNSSEPESHHVTHQNFCQMPAMSQAHHLHKASPALLYFRYRQRQYGALQAQTTSQSKTYQPSRKSLRRPNQKTYDFIQDCFCMNLRCQLHVELGLEFDQLPRRGCPLWPHAPGRRSIHVTAMCHKHNGPSRHKGLNVESVEFMQNLTLLCILRALHESSSC